VSSGARHESEVAETRRREIAAAETRRRRWTQQHGADDDSFNRPDTPPLQPHQQSPPAMYSLPADSVILRHRRRRGRVAAAMAPLPSSSSSSSSSTGCGSSGAGDGDDEDEDRRTARHHHHHHPRITSKYKYSARAKRDVSNVTSNRLVSCSQVRREDGVRGELRLAQRRSGAPSSLRMRTLECAI